MKLIVAGGRDYADYNRAKIAIDTITYFAKPHEIKIISGCCNTGTHTFTREDGTKIYGADGLGERYAQENGIEVKLMPADWEKHGRAAGPIRNKEMAAIATHCLVFWDGKSKGTLSMINEAKAKGINWTVLHY